MKNVAWTLALFCVGSAASAQISNPAVGGGPVDMSAYALKTDIPTPASSVPPTEIVGGAVGTAGTYRPASAVQPRITRAGTVTTDAGGNWSITWTTALTATPLVLPIPVNTTAQPVVCNVATTSTTGATGRCWLARTLPATLTLLSSLVSYDVFGGALAGATVQVLAIPVTQ